MEDTIMGKSQIELLKSLAKTLGNQKSTKESAFESLKAADIITPNGNFRSHYRRLQTCKFKRTI
jgi:hypothetical protein